MICKKCGSKYVVNKTYSLCEECNHIRLHGETSYTTRIRKQNAKSIYSIKKKKKLSYTRENTIKKRKNLLSLDRELYFYWFTHKDNKCEECGITLPDIFEDENGDIVGIWQYSHILSKKAFPEFRHNKLNGNRLCFKCHQIWDFGDRESMKIYKKNKIIIQKIKDIK